MKDVNVYRNLTSGCVGAATATALLPMQPAFAQQASDSDQTIS
jgi:hypothetical protein